MDKNGVTKKLQAFNAFLSRVDLAAYRDKYAKIKLVELDLPRNIQAIRFLYHCYWDNFALLDYDDFYLRYSAGLEKELEQFRREQMFSRETFYRGLPARIYRTWASLLTQIQGGYVAASLYPKVEMSADLDYAGIDMRIHAAKGGEYVNIQIKKETMSREVRTPWVGLKKGQPITFVTYEVTKDFPLTKTGKVCVPYQRWEEKWRGKLAKLDNGFVIFLPDMFAWKNIKTP